MPRTPSSTTWFRCDFVGGGSITTLRVRKRTSSVEPEESKRRSSGSSTGSTLSLHAEDRAEHLLRRLGTGLGQQQVADREPGLGREALGQPSAADRDELREQPRPLDAVVGGEEVGPLDQRARERERDPLRARLADVVEVNLGGGADEPLAASPERDRLLVEVKRRVLAEVGVKALVGQLDAVAVELGEVDRELPPVAHRPVPLPRAAAPSARPWAGRKE